ncbi:hypothetical protein [Pseudoalteromonas luteoviolacea]|uniref:hypothetical protein n=1 Tax=Pseudoalteromonas luteoviolacea TaxID=43657 RepID=UPI0012DAB40B|nr:hypothetical protein [Pseudoalteromonas luteoviolacea]
MNSDLCADCSVKGTVVDIWYVVGSAFIASSMKTKTKAAHLRVVLNSCTTPPLSFYLRMKQAQVFEHRL